MPSHERGIFRNSKHFIDTCKCWPLAGSTKQLALIDFRNRLSLIANRFRKRKSLSESDSDYRKRHDGFENPWEAGVHQPIKRSWILKTIRGRFAELRGAMLASIPDAEIMEMAEQDAEFQRLCRGRGAGFLCRPGRILLRPAVNFRSTFGRPGA